MGLCTLYIRSQSMEHLYELSLWMDGLGGGLVDRQCLRINWCVDGEIYGRVDGWMDG